MTIELNEERLTAYVVGELNEEERAAVEEALEHNDEARRTVAEIRGTAKLIASEGFEDTGLSLSEAQRAEIRAKAQLDAKVVPLTRSRVRVWLLRSVQAAAVLLLLAGGLFFSLPKTYEYARVSEDYSSEAVPPNAESVSSLVDADRGWARMAAPPSVVPAEVSNRIVSIEREPVPSTMAESEAQLDTNLVSARPTAMAQLGEQLNSLGYGAAPSRGLQFRPTESPEALSASPYDDPRQNYWPGHNTEGYDDIVENEFKAVAQDPLSTFSIDVDTASYANMRRFLNQNMLPPPDSLRIEELVNYFSYDYAPPRDPETPFASHVTVAGCPWTPEHRLVRIGLKGWEMSREERPASNLVFLIDVSGSMSPENKLPLLKKAMRLLVEQLDERDRVGIVVYSGNSGLVLPSTSGDDQYAIVSALNRLESGGSTNGGAGIELAYNVAVANYIEGGVNRVILATDGDFNVGVTNRGDLTNLIEKKAKSGVFLTVLGFGMGNVKDGALEELSNKGNGNYAYIDTLKEAKKVLVEEMGANLVTIAKDVKIQVEFNPAEVQAYRLIGYENRMLAAEDFNDDTKDAGEIGAGHTVTALYEIVPVGTGHTPRPVDPLKYQQPAPELSEAARTGEIMTLKLRYKAPDGDVSKLLEFPVVDTGMGYAEAEPDFKFAASVASFGMVLRHSQFAGQANLDTVLELAEEGRGEDPHGYRAEFIELVKKAERLTAME